ncbi:hypothetical protein COCC4DRAFT_126439 [Bipolaris maydis ATCC 48331]|uniref:Circumsporozoite protein n=2 Tax=Cochliobolus heterostrophus TaxID=5016 RepID=M2URQ7_COCH5|nr:uncharacterized protein COCC4DRAFT_126439 [Bipolaris maydis ATCC 48331]EMD90588.1 hypothetical protein COCHEDRAFT_1106738 [Bipolaris maydis C5]ENI09201.1 hypothetical protein COCC4DRAFT_126439 [Bipolaris maydis ATCC 48331]
MVSKVFIIAAVIAYVEARFGQEQIPIAAISEVKGGASGEAATLAGAAISDLLGGANSCAKLVRADQIFTELGGGADALAAAIGMVKAEKNTNPFANGNAQNVCGDASLPATPELRGITPLIDPAVDVNGAAAALSASSAANPLPADGLSVFDLMDQAGLGNLVVSQAAAGGAGGAAAGNNNAAAGNNNNAAAGNNNAAAGNNNAAAATGDNAAACDSNAAAGNGTAAADNENAAADNGNASAGNGNAANNNAGNQNNNNNSANEDAAGNENAGNQNNANAGNQNQNNNNQGAANDNNAGAGAGAAAGGADFGRCTPTIIFEGGQNGRPANEFTFQIADPLARGSQSDALNPDIITNALCNQLTNVCEANAAAITKCKSAAAAVKGGTRNKALADKFNTLIGFPGAVTNPDGGPDDVPAAKRSMRRGLRL